MTAVQHAFARGATRPRRGSAALSPAASRTLLLLIVCAAVAAGALTVDATARAAAVRAAGGDLTRLMRFMAAIKGVLALAALAGIVWRLGAPVSAARLLAYAAASAAMAAGPLLIWTMAHVGLGALLLHGGLLAAGLLLWHDPAVADRLAGMLPSRGVRPDRAPAHRSAAGAGRAAAGRSRSGPRP